MWANIISSAIPALVGGIFNRGASSAPSSSSPVGVDGSMQPSQVPTAPQAENPPPSGFFSSMGDAIRGAMPATAEMLSGTAARAFGSWATAPMQGDAVRRFNDSAYPGTTPWEQLGAGASGGQMMQAAGQADEMRQRERESQRQQETALTQTRMQASSMVAQALLQNQGSAGFSAAEQVLRASGMLSTAGFGVDPHSLSAGRIGAEIESLHAGARQSLAQADYTSGPQTDLAGRQMGTLYAQAQRDLSQADLNRLTATLNTLDRSIAVFETQNGRLAREVRSVVQVAGQGIAGAFEQVGADGISEWLRSTIVDGIADSMGSEYADEWQRILDEELQP